MRVFLGLCLLPLIVVTVKTIPGCPDIDILENDATIDEETLRNLLLCFCKVQQNDKVSISCLYGSNEDHLMRATEAVANVSMEIESISIQHMEFPETGLPDIGSAAPELKSLLIRECGTPEPLIVSKSSLKGLETSLKNFTVHGCSLEEIPKALDSLEALESLDLSSNKLQNVSASTFANKKKLNYLDLSGNTINLVEKDSFSGLDSLETLVFGEHNYVNETVLEEISKLTNLKTLDLSRADGIYEPPSSVFEKLSQMEQLKLSGCSIPSLETGVFAPLKSLKQLDLRVNLIENVSSYAFDGLSSLERLTLAGNYIRDLEKDVFVGLEHLEELDLGWNEIVSIDSEVFKPLSESLKTLNMRHNPLESFSSTGLKNLENLNLAESQLKEPSSDLLSEYENLKSIDLANNNISSLPDNFLSKQKNLMKLNLEKNNLKTVNAKILKDAPLLEEIDLSENPFLCDSELTDLIFELEDRNKAAAKNGKEFLIHNANNTKCDRPYAVRDSPIVSLDAGSLQPYDESMDTTTVPPTTTPGDVDEEPTTPFTIPDFIVGGKTNDTLFKEEPRREIYDLNKFDNPKNGQLENEGSGLVIPLTIGIMAVATLIALVAVALFVRKRGRIAAETPHTNKTDKKKTTNVEDGMEEIELDSQPSK